MSWLAVLAAAALQGEPDLPELRKRLADPAQVFPVFRELVAAGRYGTAHEVLSPAARKAVPVEALTIAFGGVEAARRLVAGLASHATEASGDAGKTRVCGAEFGAARELALSRFLGRIWTLDLTREDVEYFRGRTLGWYRLQVRRADGWHFAYPPDWTYAPLGRGCGCER
jgi:hypothetical protein